VSAGQSGFTCGIVAASGKLKCWGSNKYKQCAVPADVVDARWAAVSAGNYAACGILEETRQVRCWGLYGTVFRSFSRSPSLPSIPDDVAAAKFKSVSTGYHDACGILQGSHQVMCWGSGPQPGASPGNTSRLAWKDVSVYFEHACGVVTLPSNPGNITCWGEPGFAPPGPFAAVAWTSVSTTSSFTCGIMHNGTLACWGVPWDPRNNNPGFMFAYIGRDDMNRKCAVITDASVTWASVVTNMMGAWGIEADSRTLHLIQHILGDAGRRNPDDDADEALMKPPAALADAAWVQVSSGLNATPGNSWHESQPVRPHSCGILVTGGKLVCWGSNDVGQCDVPQV
jgi:hypothetical protein